jgi:hypothetical protein
MARRGGYFVFGRDRQATAIGHRGGDVFCLRVERSLSHSVTQSIERRWPELTQWKFYTYLTISTPLSCPLVQRHEP